MAIEAPLSKYKKNNLVIWIVFCIGLGVWCAYDGYFNTGWIDKHKDKAGNPETYLVFNRRAPFYLAGAAILVGGYFFWVKNWKVIAGDSEIIINGKVNIPYNSVQKLDKTYFDSKGFFTVTYLDTNGNQVNRKLSVRDYDNLSAVLDKLIAEIS